ncbi:MAG: hypothetical protein KU38_09755 [Sulfurovum sp. FS08-3]|nr:MAG: hypothetical protein KU38_09755 [Sulfurovum sp. FS08-3]
MKKKLLILATVVSLHAGEMAIDGYTGLTWQDNRDVVDNLVTYKKAYQYCQDLTLEGYSDWRVPTITELLTLVSYNKYKPAIIGGFNHVEDNFYWSSTPFKDDSTQNWGVDFRDGVSEPNGISYDRRVRCVRTTNPPKK